MKSINPDPEQFKKALSTIPAGIPVVMLNLLKFRETALYTDGPSEISGRDAYMRYSEKAIRHVKDVGGMPIWMGKVYAEIIAPPGETWDEVLLVRYPSIEKFLEMVTNPSYRNCAVHRSAALEDSRLIATIESEGLTNR
jgi:uncharacterized protein (DUF1330 family)